MDAPSNPAETYDRYMVPVLFGPWASRLVDLVDPQPAERILDVACGTGIVARTAATHAGEGARVTGLDISSAMLDVARSRPTSGGADIAWVEGAAEALPFPDGGFDVVLCQFALMFFTDRRAALAEMHRVLGPLGRIGLSTWHGLEQHPFYQTLHDVIRWHLGSSGVGDIFALGDAESLRGMAAEAGFHSINVRSLSMTARFPDPEGFLAGEIDVDTASVPAMQGLTSEERRSLVAQIRDDMTAAMNKVTEGDFVVIPFHAHILTAYR